MKKRKNTLAKIVASFALLSIIIGVLGTGVLFMFGADGHESSAPYTEEELQSILESFSGSSASGSIGEDSFEGFKDIGE